MNRSEVDPKDKWNVEILFSGFEAWEKALQQVAQNKTPRWPKLEAFKGKLGESAKTVKNFLQAYYAVEREVTRIYTYAHLRHDEDIAADLWKNAYNRALALHHALAEELAWVEPELLALDEKTIGSYLQSAELAEYKTALEKMVRLKPHTLSAKEEALLAAAGKSLQIPSLSFSALNDADLKFPSIKNGKGEEKELTHGTYSVYIREEDRTLRKNAFQALHATYAQYKNTFCEMLQGEIETHNFQKKARGYKSCLEAALFPHNIDLQVYHALIDAVRKSLPKLHHYFAVRKKIMGLDEQHLYDTYAPLFPGVKIKMDYKEAEENVISSVALLGDEYQKILKKGLQEERWVDRFENQGKRTGAYSSGCYDSCPYILMNFQKTLNDAFTLAHEAGHSMQTYLSNKKQPYHDAGYPIFVAEVASTFNEALFLEHLSKKESDPLKLRYLHNQGVEGVKGTLFRQTMFAEFELKLHEQVEGGVPLTPALLEEQFYNLNKDYFGPHVILDDSIAIEWARIPHFYYNFYVYQYATGISAAWALVEKVRKSEEAKKRYLEFLASGGSKFPLELLELAGVDMRKPEPVLQTIKQFENLVAKIA